MKEAHLKDYQTAAVIHEADACVFAVRRAYDGMCAAGQDERPAHEAALVVLRWHHPELTAAAALTLVRGWVGGRTCH